MIHKHTVLLVEDDPNDILLIQRAFRKAKLTNINMQVIQDGDAAIDYLDGAGDYTDRDRYPFPVLILLDLKLPRRSGLEVLGWLRQQPELRRLPVIILTSSQENIDINHAYDLGANSYLVKPLGLNALVEVVTTINMYWLLLNESPKVSTDN